MELEEKRAACSGSCKWVGRRTGGKRNRTRNRGRASILHERQNKEETRASQRKGNSSTSARKQKQHKDTSE